MALAEFLGQLDQLAADATTAFEAASETAGLEAARIEFLGAKQGRLKSVQKQMGKVEPSDRPQAGKRLNEVKTEIEKLFDAAQNRLSTGAVSGKGGGSGKSAQQFDATLPGQRLRCGHLHPITQTIEELKEIMGRLGFSVADGPEIEDEHHNFEALEHPARASGSRSTRQFLSAGRRCERWSTVAAKSDQHGADSCDGEDSSAGPHYLSRTGLSA